MIGNFFKSIFHKEKWPSDKEIRFVLSVKGGKDTVMYLTQKQFNIWVTMFNLGCQIINMPMVIATMGPKTTQEFIQ